MTNKKRIGILTSGGDCAGLNAAIRAVVFTANNKGYDVIGIKNATIGVLVEPKEYVELSSLTFDDYMMKRGGTFLGSIAKNKSLKEPLPDGSDKAANQRVVQGLRDLGIEKLVFTGGDGAMTIISKILEGSGIQFIGIPKTIDNDLGITEKAIGFDSAVQEATDAMDSLQTTAQSHGRVMVLEVMGRDAGNIAMGTGIASGADVTLIPEIPYRIEKVAEKLKYVREVEKRPYALVVVSEAVKDISGSSVQTEYAGGDKRYGGIGDYVAKQIATATGYETRAMVLGHLPRGCAPVAQDRILASALGAHAVELIDQGKSNRMVAWCGNKVVDVPIEEAISIYQTVDLKGSLVKTARLMGICLGD